MSAQRIDRLLGHGEALCRQRGVRLTRLRRQVLEIVCGSRRPLGAYEILERLRQVAPGAAPPTVYRALAFLLEQGLIHRLETVHAYVSCAHPGEPHSGQFLICTACGDVTELEDSQVARSLRKAESASGFHTERRVIEISGVCARCGDRQIDCAADPGGN